MIQRFLSTFEIARPHNMIAAGGGVFSGYFLSGGRDLEPAVWPAVLAGLVAGLGNLVNDYFDAEIDGINKPRRPIPSGRLTRRYVAWVYAVGTGVLTLAIIRWLTVPVMALMIAWEALLFVYAAYAKRVALLGNLLIASICASAFFAGAAVAGRLDIVVFPAVFAFVFVMAREFVKGAEDVEGDRRVGARTLAVRCGAGRTATWGAVLLCACVVMSPAPALMEYFGRAYAVLMALFVAPGMLAAAYLVLKFPRREVFHRASWILKLEMLAGIVVVGLGRSGV